MSTPPRGALLGLWLVMLVLACANRVGTGRDGGADGGGTDSGAGDGSAAGTGGPAGTGGRTGGGGVSGTAGPSITGGAGQGGTAGCPPVSAGDVARCVNGVVTTTIACPPREYVSTTCPHGCKGGSGAAYGEFALQGHLLCADAPTPDAGCDGACSDAADR